jgi:3-dehydroquinate dehydratase / shikimate dehydrogenase
MTYLAVPISAKDEVQAKAQIGKALAGGAEMLELRTDYIEGLTAARVRPLLAWVRQAGNVPVIVTCRDRREGGAIDYPESLRIDVLLEALAAGADFIDLEFANYTKPEVGRKIDDALARSPASRLILSAHDFTRPFDDARRLHRDIVAACAWAIPKLVYTANHINDCFAAFDLLHETDRPSIVLCMGQAGLISRVLARKLGGLVTFASLDESAATAPGQLTLAQFKGLYRHDSIDAQTELFGVIADPVGHSLSPAIHNACFGEMKMNRLYLPLLAQGGRQGLFAFLDNVLARPWLDFRGFSVTIPHKADMLDYVRAKRGSIEPLADKIGTANTLIIDAQSRLAAHNTDYAGALDAITAGMDVDRSGLRGLPVAVVGAGGVARALVAGLTDAGTKVTVYNRTVERARELAAEFGCRHAGLDALSHPVETQDIASLLVNCTSLGMYPNVNATPVRQEFLRPGMAVFDTVYNPAETLLLKQARQIGAKTIDGIAMFVNQAAAQFRLFTGQVADVELMREVIVAKHQ